jgi:hypothetical protein
MICIVKRRNMFYMYNSFLKYATFDKHYICRLKGQMLGLYKIMYLKIHFVLLTISDVANDPEPKITLM